MEPLSSVLYSLYRDTPRHGEWVVSCLEGAWPGLWGERIAGVCRPVSFSQSTLVVRVLDEAWQPVLVSMREDLVKRLRRATGDVVRDLRIVSEPDSPGAGSP